MKIKSLLSKALVLSVLAAFVFGSSFAQIKPVKKIGPGADTLITSNQTWSCDTIYFLSGHVFVTNGAELTIKPGTIVMGDTAVAGSSLFITRGSKIHAVGTPTCPIVFTSAKAPNQKTRGDWGGLVLLGNSTTNAPGGTQYIEGLANGPLTQFGGGLNPNIHDNSGELNYVRIEYAGYAFAPNNEINGLTFGAVGDGTLIDFVQVSYANDDSYEWFGGTVNCKHLIAFRGIDDDFDTDNGFSGKLQFGIGLRDPLVADVSGSKGFESDNDATGDANLPQTKAVFCNFTVSAGGDTTSNSLFTAGAHIRRNSHIYILNSIIMGYPQGLLIDGNNTGSSTQLNVANDTLSIHNLVTCKYAPKYITMTPTATTYSTSDSILLLTKADSRFYTGNAFNPLDATQLIVRKPYTLTAPDFRPGKKSPAIGSARFTNPVLSDPFFTVVTYRGAMGTLTTDNWAQVWTNFNPGIVNYRGACKCAVAAAVAAVSEDDAVAKGEVSIYPNPAKGSFNVSLNGFTGSVNVKVTNMNGSTVYNKQTSVSAKSVISVVLNNATAGLYFVTVTNGVQSVTNKINIIQ